MSEKPRRGGREPVPVRDRDHVSQQRSEAARALWTLEELSDSLVHVRGGDGISPYKDDYLAEAESLKSVSAPKPCNTRYYVVIHFGFGCSRAPLATLEPTSSVS